MKSPVTFLDAVAGYAQAGDAGSAGRPNKLATIDPAYDPNGFPATLPKVTFDGESALSGKRYPALGTYLPLAGDRVLMVPAGHTYVIVGALAASGLKPYSTRMATTVRTTVSVNVTTTEVAIGTVTATLVSGRTYRVRWTPAIVSSVSGDTAFVRLREGNGIAGAQMQIIRVDSRLLGGTGTRYPATLEAEYTAASTGSKTFSGTLIRASGTGNFTVQGDPDFPVHLYIDYIRG